MSEAISGLASAATPPPTPSASEPATSAPATTSAPAPFISLSDALQQANVGKEDVPEPTAASPTGEQPAPATLEPPKSETPVVPGEPPKERWPDILANQREKSKAEGRQEAVAEITRELEPVKAHLPIAHAIAQDVQSGTLHGLNQLLSEYAQHPQLGPQLRSMFGRALAQMRGQPPPAEEAEPQADLQTADGQLVYSAERLAQREAWRQKQWEKTLEQRLAPMQQIVREREAETAKTQYVAQAVESYKPLFEELAEMPGFAEHKADIIAKQQELFKAHPSTDPMRLLMRAYREVVPAKLQAQQQQQLEASALQKAAGRDSNPASVVAHPASHPKTLAEAFANVGLR